MPKTNRSPIIGHALTAAIVLISAAGLMWSWQQDRKVTIRSQAEVFRDAAAEAIAALDRMQHLSVLLFDEVQPALVEASEKVKSDGAVVPARDFLWKSINEGKLAVLQALAEDRSEQPIARLYSYHPRVYEWARHAVAAHQEIFESNVSILLVKTERNVLSTGADNDNYQTAILGNALRATVASIRSDFTQESEASLSALRDFLASLVGASDQELVCRQLLPESLLAP